MAKTKGGARRPRRSKVNAFFLRGLITVLPAVFTVFILVVIVRFVSDYVTKPINNTIYWSLESNGLGWKALGALGIDPYDEKYLDADALPIDLRSRLLTAGAFTPTIETAVEEFRTDNESFFRDFEDLAIRPDALREDVKGIVHPLFGLALSILLVLTLGSLAGGFFGRRIIHRIDRTLQMIPLVRSVYPYTKQLVEFFLAEKKLEFDTVVAAPYPSDGIWAIGFVTNKAVRSLRKATGQNLVSVFIPTSPMPMTGFTIFVPARKLIPLPFSVDEALRITVSGGVLVPPAELVASSAGDLLEDTVAPAPREPSQEPSREQTP